MPCAKCGSGLVIVEDYPTCPPCERIGLVPHGDSVRIMESILIEGKKNVMNATKLYDPDSILMEAFVYRELLARDFAMRYSAIDREAIIGTTVIVKELLQAPRSPGRRASAYEAGCLIRSFGILLGAWDSLYGLHAGTHRMIHMTEYDLANLRGLHISDFPIYPTEKYAAISRTFAKHGIMTEAAAEQKIREERRKWTPTELGSNKITSLELTVSTFYRVSNMLSVALTANRKLQEAFSLPDSGGIPVTFLELKGLIADIPSFHSGVTWSHASQFERTARRRLGDRYAAFDRNFVAGRDNPRAFPLFLKIGGKVYTSHFFGELYLYTLLLVLHRREFDQETACRGRVYERAVQAHFERRGFRYAPNVKKKGLLEIDGVAVSKEIAYVVEAKCWRPLSLINDPSYLGKMEQRIRGAIDGVQYERKTGKKKRVGVPLPLKVEWVRKNRNLFGIGTGVEVKGLLVVNTASHVTDHGGCGVEFISDFESELLQEAPAVPASHSGSIATAGVR